MSSESESRGSSTERDLVSPREAEIRALGRDFTSYTYDGNFCVYFKLVHDRSEAECDIKEDTFFPDFVHQFFVDSERIFGYKKPILRIFYSASRLKRYVKFDYEDKLSKEKDGIEPDNVMSYLTPILEDIEFTQDLNQFINDVESAEERNFKPPGDLLVEFEAPYHKPTMLSRAQLENMAETGDFSTNGKTNQNGHSSTTTNGISSAENSESANVKKYLILHANASTKGFSSFQARMQSLVMWFIESANMIDYEDPRWDFFMVFEKYNPNTPPVSTEDRFYFAGYATVYKYYVYPDRTRPRVSQMLLLPPYRRNGLGTKLLQSIYDYYMKQQQTLDITAEDPDEDFISMRDFLDCRNCSKLASFQSASLKAGWNASVAKEAQEKLKLCHRQARKVYEILKLKMIDMTNEDEYRGYRLEIKNRLNIPNQRLRMDCNRVIQRGFELPDDKALKIPDNPRIVAANLEVNYQLLEKQYLHVIEKLNKSPAQ